MASLFGGVFAALITPIDSGGNVDLTALERVIEFVLERGVDGIVIGGATAEYPHFSVDERSAAITQAVRQARGRKVIAAIGTSSIYSTLELARRAAAAGCDALLIPMPYFFRYGQQDLAEFCKTICAPAPIPCLLYNLPSFTNVLEVETALTLLRTIPNLAGIKDSSGNTANLSALAGGRGEQPFSLLVGDDSLLLPALQAGWDGVVSGIACFAPEAIVALYRSYRAGQLDEAARRQRALNELIDQIVQLPIPWGIRAGLMVRGVFNGPMHMPLSEERRSEMERLQGWLADWLKTQNGKAR